MKLLKTYFILLLLFSFLGSIPAYATSMTNSSFQLKLQSSTEDFSTPSKTPLIKQNVSAILNNQYILKGEGFVAFLSYEDDLKHLPLAISSSNDVMNFESLEPGEPLLRTQSISILPGSSQGYQVSAFQNHALISSKQLQIPNTSCDSGSCTDRIVDSWTSPLTYGFGYRCDSKDKGICTENFLPQSYKRYSEEDLHEFPAHVFSSFASVPVDTIISYKINISGTQTKLPYYNTVYYILSPFL